jgi:phospholipid-binding lipoprotein MlaA
MNRAIRNVTCMRLASLLALAVIVGCARNPGVAGPDGPVRGASLADAAIDVEDAPDYDPWQPFNEAMFTFNHDILDGWLVKPVATGWEKVMPAPARRSIARAFDNLDMPRRFANNLLQLRPIGASREVARFLLNTTAGVGGLFDVAALAYLEKSDADTGQTLALYGVGGGPYLVLPTMPPLTLRDAIGRTADGMLDPLGYFLPFVANQARSIVSAVNERSLNLKLFADVEESVLDLYSAARNGYLQRRRAVVRHAAMSRRDEWRWLANEPEPSMTAATAATEDPT